MERWILADSLVPVGTYIPIQLAKSLTDVRDGDCLGKRKLDCRCKFLSRSSIIKVSPLVDPRKGFLGSSCSFALLAEEQDVGRNAAKADIDSSNIFFEKDGERDDIGIQLGEGKSDILPCVGSDGDATILVKGQDYEEDNKEADHEDRSGMVDVIALAQSLHHVKSADDVEEVLKDKEDLPLQVFSSLIRSFGKEKRLRCAFALFEWLKMKSRSTNCQIRPNIFIYNSLLGAIKQVGDYSTTEKIMDDMVAEGIDLNVVTFNTLMAIYVAQGRGIEALTLFEEISKKDLTPNAASYSTALLAYRKLEDGFGALKFFLEIRDKYQKGKLGKYEGKDWDNEFAKLENFIIRICYQVMRLWLVKSEDTSTQVLRLLAEMDKAAIPAGRTEYERLLWACTREEHYVVARHLYDRLRERYSGISLSVCNHVIWLMGKAKKWWAALEIYEDLLDKGPKPNNMSYELIVSHFNILLSAARKRGIWRWAVRLLDKMEEKGLKPGSKEWNAVLIACSKASQTSAAIQVFRRMVEKGEKPTIISYGALLSALEKGKLYDQALRVWKHMLKVGVQPNLYAYTTMASIYAAQGKFNIVNSIIREMFAIGVEPTVVTFNAIISACARNKMGAAAYEWFQRMKSHKILPNDVTYEMLIEALASDGKPRLAYELFLRAQNEGLNLSCKAYDAVVQSSQAYGATIDVNILGPRPTEKRQQNGKQLVEISNSDDIDSGSRPSEITEIHNAQAEGPL